MPPSLLATVLLLQAHDDVSDAEATARAAFDLRWKVALGLALAARPFAKSTLQLFHAQLIEHEQVLTIFQRSLTFAREVGYLTGRQATALDTSPIRGRGAVKDTYNLLADGIVQLLRALAGPAGSTPEGWAQAHDLAGYGGARLKGAAGINWDDPAARRAFLRAVVADADRLLDLARRALADLDADDPTSTTIREAAELLAQFLNQDIERRADGAALRKGVSPDRVVAVHDPEMRHGCKSAAKRFDGHKGVVAVDTGSQLIRAAAVLPGNAQDHEGALALVEAAEANAAVVVAETVADCAYGDGETRQAFADAGWTLVAKAPQRRDHAYFPQDDFRIDLTTMTCVCPAGHECRTVVAIGSGRRYGAPGVAVRGFRFDAATCDACPLRPACVRARQARYVGRTKTLFQLLLAATVANLTLAATAVGLLRGRRPRPDAHVALLQALHSAWFAICRLLAVDERPARPLARCAPAGFRPRF